MKRQTTAFGLMTIAALPMVAGAMISATQQSAMARPPARRGGKAVLTVIKAEAMTAFDRRLRKKNRPADFYLITKVNSERGYKRTGEYKNQNRAYFNHKILASYSNDRLLMYTIKLLDSDPGGDDVADISPDPAQRELTVSYDPTTGAVFGPKGRRLGKHGRAITVAGDSKRNRARITFRIDRAGR